MLIAVAIVLALLAGIFAANWGINRRNTRAAARQLHQINGDPGSNRQTRISSPDRELEELLREVNITVQRRQAERIAAQRREQEIRRQIANISHDLRTPLTSILGYTELLRDGGLSPEEREEYLSIVEKRAKILQNLITGFYDLSRLEAGEFPMELKQMDLHGILCEILAAFYNDFTARGFNVMVDIPERLPPVSADGNGVERVFTNLIRNALRHGERNLFIMVSVTEQEVLTVFGNDAPRMTEEDAAHVFDRFYTADRMRTGQDTGLGLTIAQEFVREMGHSIDAELKDGVFSIRIHWNRG